MTDPRMLASAQFDKRLIVYWWLMANFALLCTLIGILAMLVWIPFGYFVHMKPVSYTHLRAHET